MCRPDTTFVTYTWQIKNQLVNATLDNPRTCRNFDDIVKWGKDNAWKTVDLHRNGVGMDMD
jgi:hypothetical protein